MFPEVQIRQYNKLAATDLFADSKSADFYFYNSSLKSRGFSEFRSRWGQRPNVDNWRRMIAVNSSLTTSPDVDPGKAPVQVSDNCSTRFIVRWVIK